MAITTAPCAARRSTTSSASTLSNNASDAFIEYKKIVIEVAPMVLASLSREYAAWSADQTEAT